MSLHINPSQTTTALKREFNTRYPFLKIEFFRFRSAKDRHFTKENMVEAEMKISELQAQHAKGSIELLPSTTVRDLEKKFSESFGLNVQVFRKSGRIWLETISTDSWTLEQQNAAARNLEEQQKAVEERQPDEEIDWSAMN